MLIILEDPNIEIILFPNKVGRVQYTCWPADVNEVIKFIVRGQAKYDREGWCNVKSLLPT